MSARIACAVLLLGAAGCADTGEISGASGGAGGAAGAGGSGGSGGGGSGGTCGGGAGAIAPDSTLAARQQQALRQVAPELVPMRPYTSGDRSDCVIIEGDGYGLVAQLELDRRSLPGGSTPSQAAPWAQYIAESILQLVGTPGAEGRCSWSHAGAPGIMEATGALAYALHRYGAGWPAATKESIRAAVEDAAWQVSPYLVNGDLDIVAAELLAGEALGRAVLWDRGLAHLRAVARETFTHGGLEMNAPLYSSEHFPALIFLQAARDPRARTLARILLEYELLVEGHLYLPGGAVSAPQSRDYSGGAYDGGDRAMLPVLWLLIGDPALAIDVDRAYDFIISAATDYAVPEIIRSIFLDKAAGYSFWMNADAVQGSARTPDAVYALGSGGAQVAPWQAVVLPGGAAALGVAYGFQNMALYVSSGVYTRIPSGGFAILFQYQPLASNDTDDTGDVMGGTGVNDDPDDFTSELYDYERLVFGRTAITLWDPTTAHKPAGVVRTFQDTRVHLPNYGLLGGAAMRAGDWRVGQLGDVYVAYQPLGTIAAEEPRAGNWTFLRLSGPSGGIVELATRTEFATLEDYARDLGSRYVAFGSDPLAAEVDARDPQTGAKVRVRLDFRPERRVVGGAEQSVEQALAHGLMQSPWVSWDDATKRLSLARECYQSVVYDWDDEMVMTGP